MLKRREGVQQQDSMLRVGEGVREQDSMLREREGVRQQESIVGGVSVRVSNLRWEELGEQGSCAREDGDGNE